MNDFLDIYDTTNLDCEEKHNMNQGISNCVSLLWNPHIIYPEYQIFTLLFITAAKLQLWTNNKYLYIYLEKYKMSNRPMKRCLLPVILRWMQIERTMKWHITRASEMTGKLYRHLDTHVLLMGTWNAAATLQNQSSVFSKEWIYIYHMVPLIDTSSRGM